VEGEVDPPSSKSYAQRAIAAALLADGTSVLSGSGNGRSELAGSSSGGERKEVLHGNASVLSGIEMCDDTEAALRVVQALGASVENTAHGTYSIRGGLSPLSNVLDIGESGLSTRLFTPIAALCRTPITITGHGSIMRRPMEMMLGPLRELGVEVTDNHGHLPITVRGPMIGASDGAIEIDGSGRNADGDSTGTLSGSERGKVRESVIHIDGSVSSQFLTGLLMALPLAAGDTTIRVRDLRSIPYIDMTIDTMRRFGVEIDHRDYEEFYIPGGQRYRPTSMKIEGDWSAASCLLVAGAVAGEVTVRNLNPVSLQADVRIIEALSAAGAHIVQTEDSVTVSRRELRPFSFDATDCPDLFPALAALAASCEGVSTISGTRRLAHKESDRAAAIRSEYGRLGVEVDLSEENVMRITGGAIRGGRGAESGIEVDSHADHRMAMSLAVAALSAGGPVVILGAECVSKSYSDFWEDFERIKKTGL
jgi:3-phosphoshikimate 1-carboxyvinyltransferase